MKILILCLPGIGDALMATPTIKLLKRKYPRSKIDVLCMFKGVEYVFKNNPYVNKVYYVSIFSDNRLLAVYHLLPFLFKRYDISLLTFPEYRKEYNIVQTLIFAKKRISHKFRKGFYSELNFLNTDLVDVDENIHNLENNLNLLKPLGGLPKNIKKSDLYYDLKIDKEDELYGKVYIEKLGWNARDCISLHPGSIDSKAGVYKRWSIKNFADISRYLIKKHNKKIIVFCGPSEQGLGKKILLLTKNKNCHLVENVSFGQALGILKQCSLLVSNDNGFAHLSNALKVESIVLFGPTNPLWCSPYNKKYNLSIRLAKFTPWFRNDMKVDNPPRGVKSGMDAISVDYLRKILDKKYEKK